jgi:hypothetical protein
MSIDRVEVIDMIDKSRMLSSYVVDETVPLSTVNPPPVVQLAADMFSSAVRPAIYGANGVPPIPDNEYKSGIWKDGSNEGDPKYHFWVFVNDGL